MSEPGGEGPPPPPNEPPEQKFGNLVNGLRVVGGDVDSLSTRSSREAFAHTHGEMLTFRRSLSRGARLVYDDALDRVGLAGLFPRIGDEDVLHPGVTLDAAAVADRENAINAELAAFADPAVPVSEYATRIPILLRVRGVAEVRQGSSAELHANETFGRLLEGLQTFKGNLSDIPMDSRGQLAATHADMAAFLEEYGSGFYTLMLDSLGMAELFPVVGAEVTDDTGTRTILADDAAVAVRRRLIEDELERFAVEPDPDCPILSRVADSTQPGQESQETPVRELFGILMGVANILKRRGAAYNACTDDEQGHIETGMQRIAEILEEHRTNPRVAELLDRFKISPDDLDPVTDADGTNFQNRFAYIAGNIEGDDAKQFFKDLANRSAAPGRFLPGLYARLGGSKAGEVGYYSGATVLLIIAAIGLSYASTQKLMK